MEANMKFFSRFSATLLVAAAALTLGSLVTAQDMPVPDMGVTLNPEVTGNVEFWHHWGSPVRRTAIRRVVAMCQQALPNITVEEVFKPFGEGWTANIAAVAAGSGMPDVIVSDRLQLPRDAADGIYQNIQEWADRDGIKPADFYPFAWDQTLYEGASYGLPQETDVRVMFYNKNLFTEVGLDPAAPPQTWEELEAAADKLDIIGEDGTIQRMGFFPLVNVGPDIWALTNGQVFVKDGKVVMNSPEMAGTVEWIKSWVDRYGGWDKIQEFRATFGAPPNDAFMSGKVAILPDVAGYLSQLNFYRPRVTLADGSTPNIDVGVAPLPYGTTAASWSGGFSFSIPTGAENAEAGWEFIKCATGPVAQASWARDTYAIPSRVAAANDPVLMADPNWQFFVKAMDTSTSSVFVPEYPNYMEQFNQRAESVWRGDLTVEQALTEAQTAIDDAVANAAP
jgi:multiple sugar transport system substrate-binding protein